jgi:K+-sensing histidine kinase KdpD
MLLNELLEPLAVIAQSCEVLLSEAGGLLNVYQERVVISIRQVTSDMQDLLISLPDLNSANTHDLLSYETRSHLASIIGYSEVLLDEEDGSLSDTQKQHVQNVRTAGKRLLGLVMQLLEEN